jgi:hypothetical protein
MRGQLRHSIIAAGLAGVLVLAGCSSGHHPTANGPGGSTTTTSTPTDPSTSPTTTGSSTTGQTSTSTTILGPSGSPKNYPAAQATPPSLAGAYPQGNTVNLVTVLKALQTYSDWVWSHPNPSLVSNYDLPVGTEYSGEVARVTRIRDNGWHADPTPTEILWAKVTRQPLRTEVNGKPQSLKGHPEFSPGLVIVVDNEVSVPMLTASGQPTGQQFNPPSTGQVAFLVTLSQGPDGQFRFYDASQLNPTGGIAGLEAQK